jgi:hypothetical protein
MSSPSVLLVLLLSTSRRALGQLAMPGAVAPACDFGKLDETVRRINGACASHTAQTAATAACDLGCAAVLFSPQGEGCLPVLEKMYVSGNHGAAFKELSRVVKACQGLPPRSVVDWLGKLQKAGRCPGSRLGGVAQVRMNSRSQPDLSSKTPPAACVNSYEAKSGRNNCNNLLHAGLTCSKDFCRARSCRYKGLCDKMCHLCEVRTTRPPPALGNKCVAEMPKLVASTHKGGACCYAGARCNDPKAQNFGLPKTCSAACAAFMNPWMARCSAFLKTQFGQEKDGANHFQEFERFTNMCKTIDQHSIASPPPPPPPPPTPPPPTPPPNPFFDTVVEHKSASVDKAHATYTLAIRLKAAAKNVYTIFGDRNTPMILPPAFQMKSPFGANVGGVDPMFYQFKPASEFDSWITIGITQSDSGKMGTIGIKFDGWTEKTGITVTNGAVFYMDPNAGPSKTSKGPKCCTKSGDIVLAQLTVKAGYNGYAQMDIGGHSTRGSDWHQKAVMFKLL